MTARSYLFVPADRPERYAKALASGADAVVFDLEDAVAPAAKDAARDALARWLGDAPAASRPQVVVRLNGADTPWFDADRALVCAAPRVAAVMLPKADAASPWDAFDGKPVLALIETAAGIDALRSIAAAPPVRRLVFGSIDLQLDLGIGGDGDELLLFRSKLVLASRLAELPAPVDGVSPSLTDTGALADDVQRARRLGFSAKLCIHPAQVAVVNDGLRPSAAEIAWAQRVLAAAALAGGAAVAVDGKMVDRPVAARARALLDSAAPDAA
jgi:citrate lyase subunit beta / citryl-CoA lyase